MEFGRCHTPRSRLAKALACVSKRRERGPVFAPFACCQPRQSRAIAGSIGWLTQVVSSSSPRSSPHPRKSSKQGEGGLHHLLDTPRKMAQQPVASSSRQRQDYDFLIKLLLIGDSGEWEEARGAVRWRGGVRLEMMAGRLSLANTSLCRSRKIPPQASARAACCCASRRTRSRPASSPRSGARRVGEMRAVAAGCARAVATKT